MKLFNTRYQGEGWYTFRLWNNETNEWGWAGCTPAVWVEDEYEFRKNTTISRYKEVNGEVVLVENEGVEIAAYYYGDGEVPNAPVEIDDWYYPETLTPKSQAAYKEMMGW